MSVVQRGQRMLNSLQHLRGERCGNSSSSVPLAAHLGCSAPHAALFGSVAVSSSGTIHPQACQIWCFCLHGRCLRGVTRRRAQVKCFGRATYFGQPGGAARLSAGAESRSQWRSTASHCKSSVATRFLHRRLILNLNVIKGVFYFPAKVKQTLCVRREKSLRKNESLCLRLNWTNRKKNPHTMLACKWPN